MQMLKNARKFHFRREKQIPTQFQYKMNNSNSMILTLIMNLGILLSNDLSFNNHITIMCNKKSIRFCNTKLFRIKNPNCFKLLHCFSVHFILEYGPVIWNPYQTGLISKIERVQKRFLRELAYKFNRTDVLTRYL